MGSSGHGSGGVLVDALAALQRPRQLLGAFLCLLAGCVIGTLSTSAGCWSSRAPRLVAAALGAQSARPPQAAGVGAFVRSLPAAARAGGAQQQQQLCSRFIPPFKGRDELARTLQAEGMAVGAELGVQYGLFSEHNLRHWLSCRKYFLIDAWRHQANYTDVANVGQEQQDKILALAQQRLAPWQSKLVWLRMWTTQAAPLVDEPLDFVYVDARHDYCGVADDLAAYWPLLRPGGIMAGHDYEDAADVKARDGQDWSLCGNGTVHAGAVRGAVNDFFSAQGLQVLVAYREGAWNSWAVRKPHPCGS